MTTSAGDGSVGARPDLGVEGEVRAPHDSRGPSAGPPVPAPPQTALCQRVRAVAEQLQAAGEARLASELREALETWMREQRGWTVDLARQLGVHHDINNALVGVRGNVQLLLLGPAGQASGTRDRLEVVLRESDRIRDAATRLNALKIALTALTREDESTGTNRAA